MRSPDVLGRPLAGTQASYPRTFKITTHFRGNASGLRRRLMDRAGSAVDGGDNGPLSAKVPGRFCRPRFYFAR
jgi:hypothetical protein